MLTPVTLNSGNSYPYGFGWSVSTIGDHPVHHHGGGWQGFRTYFVRYLEPDLAIIVLANSTEASPDAIAVGVAEALDPTLAPPPPASEPIDDPEPEVTAFIASMLDKAATSGLELSDFAFIRQTSFPYVRDSLAETLAGLGAPDSLELLDREQLGDDTRLTYRVSYGDRTFRAGVGIGPEGGLTRLRIREIEEG